MLLNKVFLPNKNSLILIFALAKYLESISLPINFLLFFKQAIAVVAEPLNGSKTKSFSFVWIKSISHIKFKLFCVGWILYPLPPPLQHYA